jgi:hypothetical protein
LRTDLSGSVYQPFRYLWIFCVSPYRENRVVRDTYAAESLMVNH